MSRKLTFTAFAVISLCALLLATMVSAQDTILIITPTVESPATPAPVVNSSQATSVNPKPAELPIISSQLAIDTTRKDGYVITDSPAPIYVREGAGVEYRPLAISLGGVALDATGVNEQQTWWRVRTAGDAYEGWINAELLILRGDLTDVPVIAERDMGATLPVTYVTFTNQPLYREPIESSDLQICEIAPNENVVLGRDRTGNFYQIAGICTDGRLEIGYILSSEVGAFRNPYGVAVPIVGTLFLPEVLNEVAGPSLLVYQRQTVYLAPAIRPSTTGCTIFPNRYPIIARDAGTEFYLIETVCLDGAAVTAWIPSGAGDFQTTNEQTSVPVAITAVPTETVSVLLPDDPRFVTSLPQSLTLDRRGDTTLCQIPAGEHLVIARTATDSDYRLSTTCIDGTTQTGWIRADLGAFRNPNNVSVAVDS